MIGNVDFGHTTPITTFPIGGTVEIRADRAAPDHHQPLMASHAPGVSGPGPPAEPPADYPGLFMVERDRLRELLAGLAAADWEQPSPCPGWSVLGVCCHLVGDDLGLLARHRDSYDGTPAPGALVAGPAGWEFRYQPGPRAVASLTMSTEQAWRLLTSNPPAAGQADLAVSGDNAITSILLRTRAIIGTPK